MRTEKKPDKNYPVKIFDNLYIIGIANATANERKKFLKLSQIEMIEELITKDPSIKRTKNGVVKDTIYTPSFGDFIISPFKGEMLKFYDMAYTQRKSEEFYSKFREEYNKMTACYKKLEKLINIRYTL